MTVTISAKVPKKLKEKARHYGVRISQVVRKALEREVARAEEEKLRKRLEMVRSKLKGKLKPRDVVNAVRASREER